MKANTAIVFLTAHLIAFLLLFQYNASPLVLAALFLLFPFAFIVTVFIILKDTSRRYPEFSEDEEWGYQDKPKAGLGTF